MEEYQISQGKRLRCGYTTGSCATAAAKAAAVMLLTRERIDCVQIDTPKGIVLNLEPEEVEVTADKVTCAIRKDSGDDPDDTNGILIYATVEKTGGHDIELCGGNGIGQVTKPGLACAVGGPAINPTPRRMIIDELTKVMTSADYQAGLKVTIAAPAGVEIAKKTFNPRLGILGGISILGTSGIVEPMSEKALVETMYVEIDAQAAAGNKNLLVFFGNYGEDFTRDVLGLDIADAVTCSNFVGELLDYAVYKGFETLLLIGHSGKLVKLAQGVMNTHSKYADCRTELLALHAMFAGAGTEVGKEIAGSLTTDEAVKVLQREGIFEEVVGKITERIDFYMQHRVHGKIKTAALMFSNVYGILGKTAVADELVKLHLKDKQEG
ncbi:cobalt-precorrin-5B (C(1))-methyltransferase CbiD [Phascolarctobacterium sp.]|uniref:cobalt-precorrin-5B (C(1))-methyltransferase CbiD n=1 Tax=Phascolarctobacterium sp. TaxID=2049039 RepID=UPI0015AC02F7|nr:cobalt-precorrin-5B (C(1))-methyltransferase CbiD [uncultured Phascolarctobacterium sp.]